MDIETEIYQILKKHRLPLKKREELIIDLLEFVKELESEQSVCKESEVCPSCGSYAWSYHSGIDQMKCLDCGNHW